MSIWTSSTERGPIPACRGPKAAWFAMWEAPASGTPRLSRPSSGRVNWWGSRSRDTGCFKDGHTRIDYAAGYLGQIPGARFLVADYVDCELPADVITAWFPFLTPAALLAWRLPLSLLTPERMFARIHHNLRPKGLLVMVNHGAAEAAIARELCDAAGLTPLSSFAEPGALSAHRPVPRCCPAGRGPRLPRKYSYLSANCCSIRAGS